MAPHLVAADSGADRCLTLGANPEAVIGDMDSVRPETRAKISADRWHRVAEQDSTDFDKALRLTASPFVLALGFLGARVDHELAVLNVLTQRWDRRCVLIGAKDVIFAAPRFLHIDMRAGDRFSLFPMQPINGRSRGLEWPIDDIPLAPWQRTSTSNRVTDGPVDLDFDQPGTLVIVARHRLPQALAALGCGAAAR